MFDFDPNTQEGSNRRLIPKGKYMAEIISADVRQPSSGDGHMLCLTWKIVDGEYENRQIFQNLCYQHSNEMAQDIARRFIKDLCIALNITEQINDPTVFLYKPLKVRVGVTSDKNGQYDDQNRIVRMFAIDSEAEEAEEAKEAKANSSPAKPTSAKPAASTAPSKPQHQGPGAAPWK